jgi:hypothetical protein
MRVSDADVAFPASVKTLMPPNLSEVRVNKSWERFVDDWFFRGADSSKLVPKPGIDKQKAIRHLQCILGSFELTHEDKRAAVTHLLGEWFEPLQAERAVK